MRDDTLTTHSSPRGSMGDYVVIKLGGEVVASPDIGAVATDVKAMQAIGERVVVVHGGGAQATSMQKRLGQTPTMFGV